jgi:hypothetical protein
MPAIGIVFMRGNLSGLLLPEVTVWSVMPYMLHCNGAYRQ